MDKDTRFYTIRWPAYKFLLNSKNEWLNILCKKPIGDVNIFIIASFIADLANSISFVFQTR